MIIGTNCFIVPLKRGLKNHYNIMIFLYSLIGEVIDKEKSEKPGVRESKKFE